ncbi:N-acetyltransferase family protein [Desulfonatronum parangueonense]
MSLLRKIRQTVKVISDGDLKFFISLLHRNIWNQWDMELFEYDVNNSQTLEPIPGLITRKGNHHDIPDIIRIWPDQFVPKAAKKKSDQYVLSQVQKSLAFYVAEIEGKVVSVIFVQDASAWCGSPAREVAKGFTDPEFRGRRIFRILEHYICQEIGNGVRIFGQIHHSNSKSIFIHKKIGFKHVGKLRTSIRFGKESYKILPTSTNNFVGVC